MSAPGTRRLQLSRPERGTTSCCNGDWDKDQINVPTQSGQPCGARLKLGTMDIRQITPTYFVSPQLDPSDMPALAEAGIATIICNRPDGEVPPSHQADALEAAAVAAGLAFHRLPLTHQTMTPDNVARHIALVEAADGPAVAYCASGTRSTVVWCLGQAKSLGVDAVLAAARAGGYDLENLRPTLEVAAQQP